MVTNIWLIHILTKLLYNKSGGSSMQTVRSVERALSILETLRIEKRPMKLSELSDATDLSNATLLRLLRTMQEKDFITINETNNTYYIGNIFLNYAQAVTAGYDLRSAVNPLMRSLRDITGETVNLYIISGTVRICLDQVESDRSIKSFSKIGDIKPLYCGASGKVLLAYSDEKLFNDVVEETGLKPYTSVKTTRGDLAKELINIKELGYATSYGEREVDVASVAVPLLGFNGNLVGAVSVSGPIERLGDKLTEYSELMKNEQKKLL